MDESATGPAGFFVSGMTRDELQPREPRRLARLAGREPRVGGRDLARLLEEGVRQAGDRLGAGGRDRAPLRLDRRPDRGHRRRALRPALHATSAEEQVVEGEQGDRAAADRRRRDEADGAARGRGREGERRVGSRVHGAAPTARAGRPEGGDQGQPGGEGDPRPREPHAVGSLDAAGSRDRRDGRVPAA